MFGYNKGITTISSGRSNGRSVYDLLMKGRIAITGEDGDGNSFQRIVEVRDGEVWDNTFKEDGKIVHRIAYGQFEKIKLIPEGTEVVRFKKGTGKGKHGKAFRDENHCHIYLDEKEKKRQDKYSCDYHLSVTPTGEVYNISICGKDPKKDLFMGALYGFERSLFQMYAAKIKIVIDEGSVDTYYGDGD